MPVRPETEGSPRYWAWLYSPPRLRAVLDALLGVEAEIRAALRPGLDHQVAHVRLQWWREECARYARGSPTHPLMRALSEAYGAAWGAERGEAPPDAARLDPCGLVDIVTWDLASATFANRAELAGYCDRWASAVTLIAAQGARFGRSLGNALEEIELLAALAADAKRGRLRLPLDELEQAHVEPSTLAHPPWPAPLCALLRSRQRASRAALAASVAELPPALQPSLRGLLVWAAVAHRESLRAERALPHSWQADRASRLADAWIGWRAARHAERREFHLHPEVSA